MPNLEILNIEHNTNITNFGIQNHVNLTDLNLENNSLITNNGIKKLHNLTKLNLKHNTKITNKGMELGIGVHKGIDIIEVSVHMYKTNCFLKILPTS